MTKDKRARIPVNIVAGPLGVGKTTAINHLLSQRPAHERWAVLVNEYGQVGLDAALMTDSAKPAGGVEVREVAGGCICCSAGFMFDVSLVVLLQRRPDRLLIEPTGLATLSGILDTLARRGVREAVDVRSVISLVDPARLQQPEALPVEVQDQIEAADVLLANRSDLATPAQLDAFEAWASKLFPPKRLVARIERGRLPLEVLDLVTQRSATDPVVLRSADTHGHERHHAHRQDTASAQAHEASNQDERGPSQQILRHSHDSPLASTMGWTVWAERVFDARLFARWLEATIAQPGLRRLKAVLNTDEGWSTFNVADGARSTNPTAYRRDSRLELIWMGESRPDPESIEATFLSCLKRSDEPLSAES